ncbi:ABC transporter permease [Agrobacterium tumefaciens]|jgi:iron complex transport system permease protein|uniref:ABC transporter, membrane spanning protein (Iron) n=1 Tax=Agrobacterium fabrum (strain C58 / ATCC 33970) TaxID=176299 RepID=A9CLD6_AGRFC|nr:Fe(3+)-siderophore ABC transporter permease [Agrobacterium fabrum]KEY50054.1 ABC transporter permease [Agrobacterium tumefaciens]AAK90688.1 ABC transporter, membrane spanning protein (iron) [Agrobacterium fabrum str. C58]KJX90189.1 Vitamin B12 import system permease protein btuC [Agrobacterium tumefaciens]MCX2878417.1 Fe(3+)-siderophore ABC transporter permease [Agrobacterium fabrum]QQN09042.1 Fe(3+)-siderophore ABC transporter permease [Agrobacterium fabrum]
MTAQVVDQTCADPNGRPPAVNGPCGRAWQLRARLLVLVALSATVLMLLFIASLLTGARAIAPSTGFYALFAYDPASAEHIIIRDYRLPRTLLGLLCGAAFGVSGALIQAITRNPLADPGILGVNAGAAFFVTLAVGLLGFHAISSYLWFAFLGAVAVTLIVYSVGSRGRDGASPARLVLSGVALSAVLGGIGSAITLLDPRTFDGLRVWSIGSLSGRNMDVVLTVAPFIIFGLVLSLCVAPSLNAVALGDDPSRALGVNLVRTRILVVIAVTLLAGAATAAAGPIGFIGLMVPHVVRWLSGPDQRRIIAFTILCSPILLLTADIAGRLVLFSGELEAGIVTAFIGAPVLIVLALRRRASGL